ncbi:17039_t:CDS:2 [Acaulospora colombiana]|uniref:17039_t:CDS:1 n=1 Tax=Acaulospora colombiana TaxID=27376 RepID=A0ACA9P169_9GLOM|nr:17039_t:CDS:2 [Acaulospora colombiana]
MALTLSQDFGVTRTVNLKPNGGNIPVTKENRIEYIYLVSHYRLTRQIKKQTDAFFEGLSEIIDPKWLRMFNQQELKVLVGGAEEPIDLDDLRDNVVYGGLYDENHAVIRMFWRVVKSLDQDKRRQLLRFVTSCARPPLLGFKELYPKFAIRDAGKYTNPFSPDFIDKSTSFHCIRTRKRCDESFYMPSLLVQVLTYLRDVFC